MTKKFLLFILSMCVILNGCANTVSQKDYDKAVSEVNKYKEDYDNTVSELDALKEKYEQTTSEFETLKEEYNNVTTERDQYKTDYENAMDEIAELENLSTKNSLNNTSTYSEKSNNSGISGDFGGENSAPNIETSTPDNYNTGD